MKILIIGSGAREHAIARALARSLQKPHLFCCGTTANPGIQALVQHYWVGDICNADQILECVRQWKIDFAIIGPEAPLAAGLADILWAHDVPTIGPQKKLAQIETSKSFIRKLFEKYHILGSPRYKVFHDMQNVSRFLQELGEGNYVIKANGLMGGKGVKVAGDHLFSMQDAEIFCQSILQQRQSFLIEEKLIGQEFSLLYFCDGTSLIAMPLVQDHKRAFINDEGPNTGGMGSYSQADHSLPFLTDKDLKQAQQINEAMLSALTAEYREKYIGIIYSSFIATQRGVYLIEYNARFGDPEAMNVLAILESDFVEICKNMLTGRLLSSPIHFSSLATVCKYAVPTGYPDHPLQNNIIDVSAVHSPEHLYYAAVDQKNGQLYTTHSRAVAVLGMGKTTSEAERIAEEEMNRIRGPLFHRSDIGTDALIAKRIQHMRSLRE